MKYLIGEASHEEKQAVKEWLEKEASNRVYFDQLKKIWDSSKQLAAVSTVDVDKAWEKFRSGNGTRNTEVVKQKSNRYSWLRIAASLIIVAAIGIISYIVFNNSSPKQLIVQTTGNVLIDTLPDGSEVTLNKRSTISYPSKFKGDKRSVALTGEAFFNVVPNKKKPFIIDVNDLQVTVVGTSFNVKSEKGNTEVVVETGIVRVTRNGQSVELRAGEKILFSKNDSAAAKQQVSDKLYNYYRSKEFVCDGTPLWKLVKVLNEAYDANIVIGRKELNNLQLNTTFNNESLDKILEIIHLTFDLTVTRKDDGQIVLE